LQPMTMKNPRQPSRRGFPETCFRIRGRAAILRYGALECVRRRILEIFQRLASLFRKCLESLRLMDRHVGENLAVNLDPGLVQAVDEAAIGQAVFASGGIDALDPQGAKIALAIAPVARRILHRFLDGLPRNADRVLATAAKALRRLENLLVPGIGGYAALDVCH